MAFWERMEEIVDKGAKASRDLWGKAKVKAKDLSEKGILKFEIGQLERQAQGQLALLGTRVYDALVRQEEESVSRQSPEIASILTEIEDIRARVEEKEEALKRLG